MPALESIVKVGDLVKHKRFGNIYIVAKLNESSVSMIGVIISGELRWILRNWLEVVSAA